MNDLCRAATTVTVLAIPNRDQQVGVPHYEPADRFISSSLIHRIPANAIQAKAR